MSAVLHRGALGVRAAPPVRELRLPAWLLDQQPHRLRIVRGAHVPRTRVDRWRLWSTREARLICWYDCLPPGAGLPGGPSQGRSLEPPA